MDRSVITNETTGHWGVVYSYGSVLALFETEQDATREATCFGGAVVCIARQLWSTLSEAVPTALLADPPRSA